MPIKKYLCPNQVLKNNISCKISHIYIYYFVFLYTRGLSNLLVRPNLQIPCHVFIVMCGSLDINMSTNSCRKAYTIPYCTYMPLSIYSRRTGSKSVNYVTKFVDVQTNAELIKIFFLSNLELFHPYSWTKILQKLSPDPGIEAAIATEFSSYSLLFHSVSKEN